MQYKHIFYGVIGKHAGEQVEDILKRKQKEIADCNYSLWSAKIDKKSIEQVWNLDKEEKLYVLCKINKNAKDPVIKTIEPYYAQKAYAPFERNVQEILIPKSIKTSFTKGKNYQASVVEKYELLEQSILYDFGNLSHY